MSNAQKDVIPAIKMGFVKRLYRLVRENIKIAVLRNKIADNFPGDDLGEFLERLNTINRNVPCAHNPSHALEFILDMLRAPRNMEGCFIEAGCFKGGSTAKFSIVAHMLGRKLVVFDSFEGLPENSEEHDLSLQGHSIKGWFDGGRFTGTLNEVKQNISTYGEIDACSFMPGWFENTMPDFLEPILAGFIDVDLASSTKTCLKFLYPRLVDGGVLCSQDGDFPLVVEVFKDSNFWAKEVGVEMPVISGLGEKITRIRKTFKSPI